MFDVFTGGKIGVERASEGHDENTVSTTPRSPLISLRDGVPLLARRLKRVSGES